MEERCKHVIQLHRQFLTKNIVWTDDLVKALQDENLLPDSVYRAIQEAKTREEKVGCVLNILPIRGVSDSFGKFCDVIQKCGHDFVADFLRDEDILATKFDTREMYKRLPFLDRLRNNEKAMIEKFFIDKFRKEALKMVWKDDVKDKEKAVEARRKLIEQNDQHRNEANKWHTILQNMERKLEDSKMEITGLNSHVRSLEGNLKEMSSKHHGDVNSQMRFNQANENQLQKAKDKLSTAQATLRDIKSKLDAALQSRPRQLTEKQEVELHINEFAFLNEDVDRLLEKHDELKTIGLKYFDLCEQRDYCLTHMGFETGHGAPSLLDAYREFAVKTEETMTELQQKISEYGEIVETSKKKSQEEDKKKNAFQMGATVWQSAIMNVMRSQLQDVKLENRKKDTRIQLLETEGSKSKSRITELEQELKRLKNSRSRTSRELLSVDNINGDLSVSTDRSDRLGDFEDENRRQNILPHIHKQTYPAPQYTVQTSSTTKKPNEATRQMGMPSNKFSVFPEGLTTAPLRLENKTQYNKYLNKSVPGLGDLKAMNARNKFEKSLNPTKVRN
ncbi:myosin heavy chain, striated muscle-like isoform X3 [Ostrea edulis]|uniref:myosin heavy chain, striated muscle-like isoform X3 n=1 Tax=Ostrea edulis TaxID=37623 RepID=UPI0024AFAF16|nr:myosin heavy chain, striated muscle-like isoform X3 [Ostrea edulis]